MREDFHTPEEVFRWAESFTNLERGALPSDKRSFRLDRMRIMLELFGNPDRSWRILHVAGTKGKGSTSALLSEALHASGQVTGLYTSPHVASAFERMSIAGRPPMPELLVGAGHEARDGIATLAARDLPGGFAPTTFELYTLLAFLYFRAAGCNAAVVEVGIGGRLDATNIVTPEASVITPLDLEHTEILGDTIAKIAFEKAGIIKPGVPAFIGFQPEEAKEVFRGVGRERGSAVAFLDEERESLDVDISPHGTRLGVKLSGEPRVEFTLSLLGEFQAENAALAFLTLRRVMPQITVAQCQAGFLAARLPGRMELLPGTPPIVLDGAHTPLAVRRLIDSFKRIFPGRAVLIFGSVAGKKPKEMAESLAPLFERIIISTPGTFKTSNPEEVHAIFKALNPSTVLAKEPEAALEEARRASDGTMPILVTGSFYMVSEIRRLLLPGS